MQVVEYELHRRAERRPGAMGWAQGLFVKCRQQVKVQDRWLRARCAGANASTKRRSGGRYGVVSDKRIPLTDYSLIPLDAGTCHAITGGGNP